MKRKIISSVLNNIVSPDHKEDRNFPHSFPESNTTLKQKAGNEKVRKGGR